MLKKQNRLRTNYQFYKTRRFGKKASTSLFDFYCLEIPNETSSKVGIVVSNKISKVAPKRNRLKRLFRESFRNNFDKIKTNCWIAVYPKYSAIDKTYEEINSELTKVLQKVFISR